MNPKPLYTVSFLHEGRYGMVHIFPAVAYVNWGGMSFTTDDCGPDLMQSIYRSRLKGVHS
jgi:hypothetical protein